LYDRCPFAFEFAPNRVPDTPYFVRKRDGNKHSVQQKAVLKGQLKQLQSQNGVGLIPNVMEIQVTVDQWCIKRKSGDETAPIVVITSGVGALTRSQDTTTSLFRIVLCREVPLDLATSDL